MKTVQPEENTEKKKPQRQPGSLKGLIWMRDDFDAPLPPGLLEAFFSVPPFMLD
jgi:Protein of unknown function (DUF2281)